MINLNILISGHFFFDLTSLKKSKKKHQLQYQLFLTIINQKIVLQKLLGSLNLIKTQAFYIYELTGVVIVSKNKNLIFAAFQVVMPSLISFNNSKRHLIIYFASSIYKNHFLRKKNYQVLLTNFRLKKIRIILVDHIMRSILI